MEPIDIRPKLPESDPITEMTGKDFIEKLYTRDFEKIIGFSFIENYEKDDSLCQYCKNLVFSNPCDPNYYLFIFYMHIKSFFIHGDCFEEIFCNCNTVQ